LVSRAKPAGVHLMKIKNRLEFANKPPVITLRGEEKVSTTITSMTQRNICSVVIVDGDLKVLGIVTERDLVRRLPDKKT
jgi:CBS domain-containing protein